MKIKSSMYFNTSKMSKNSKKAKINSKILNVSDSNSSETMSDFITSFKSKHNDLCNDIKQETDESFLDISICSQLSDASKERNEAFHKWLMAQPDATPKIPEFSNRLEKLQWLQKQRDIGVYVICDNCDKMRYLKDVKDPLELPKYWYCTMNPDEHQNNCSYSQITLTSLELRELVNNIYNAGSIVWAKVEGHPWMPAMIDDDPDLETFFFTGNDLAYDDPTEYHVTFFGKKVRRAWCKLKDLKPFKMDPYRKIEPKFRRHEKALELARLDALQAIEMPHLERLQTYSFISRWKKTLD